MGETLLIVDYNKNLRMLYDLELSEEGYQVLLAENKDEAMKILKDECPDLVIIDGEILLSGGINSLESIRSFCSRTVIVLNDVNYDTCENLLDSYLVDDCIIKSSDIDQLRCKIKTIGNNELTLFIPVYMEVPDHGVAFKFSQFHLPCNKRGYIEPKYRGTSLRLTLASRNDCTS